MKFRNSFVVVLSLLAITSCQKEFNDLEEENSISSGLALERNVGNLNSNASQASASSIAAFYSNYTATGQYYHSWMRSLISTADWNALSASDKYYITNFTSDNYAALAIYYNAVKYKVMAPSYFPIGAGTNYTGLGGPGLVTTLAPSDKFYSCLAVATGLTAVQEIFNLGALDAAVASQSAVRILKTIGRRYL